MRSSVVLPEPDGPSSATSSPARMSSETPCSAGVAPKVLATFSTAHPWAVPSPDRDGAPRSRGVVQSLLPGVHEFLLMAA